jgi:tetratricopeptide (TPR) repeat protein
MINIASDRRREGKLGEDSFLRLEVSVLTSLADLETLAEQTTDIVAYALELAVRGDLGRAGLVLEHVLERVTQPEFPSEAVSALHLAQARVLIAGGDLEAADVALAALVEGLEPSDHLSYEASVALGTLRATAGQFDSAASVLEAALEPLGGTQWAETAIMAAECRLAAGQVDSALSLLQGVVGSFDCAPPLLSRAVVLLAESLMEQGKFQSSSDSLRGAESAWAHQPGNILEKNLATYVRAWNLAGRAGATLIEVMTSPGFEFHTDPNAGGAVDVFDAWRLLQGGKTHDSIEAFRDLRSKAPTWGLPLRSQNLMALEGEAYAEVARGNDGAAVGLFEKLARAQGVAGLAAPVSSILNSLSLAQAAHRAGKSNPVDIVRHARRQAQTAVGTEPVFLARIMDFEAELLTEAGAFGEARSIRKLALSLLEDAVDGDVKIRLAHEVGYADLTAKSGDLVSAECELTNIIPRLRAEFGNDDSLTAVARYALISVRSGLQSPAATLAQFQELRRDLHEGLGADHILTIKAGYGVGRNLQKLGRFGDAAGVFGTLAEHEPSSDDKHDFLARVMKRWAECLYSTQQYSKAADKYADCIARIVASAGAGDSRVMGLQLSHARSLAKAGHYKEARRIFRQKWQLLHAAGDTTSDLYVEAVLGNANCLEHLGDHAGAAFNLARVLVIAAASDHFSLDRKIELYELSAWNLEMAGRRIEAAAHYDSVAELLVQRDPSKVDRLLGIRHRAECCRAGVKVS